MEIDFLGCFFAFATDEAIHFFFGRRDDFFDPSRMDPSIGDEFGHRLSSDFSPDWIEPAYDDHPWCIVDNQIAAGSFFEGTDVASFPTDDSAFHFVIGDIDRGSGAFGRLA